MTDGRWVFCAGLDRKRPCARCVSFVVPTADGMLDSRFRKRAWCRRNEAICRVRKARFGPVICWRVDIGKKAKIVRDTEIKDKLARVAPLWRMGSARSTSWTKRLAMSEERRFFPATTLPPRPRWQRATHRKTLNKSSPPMAEDAKEAGSWATDTNAVGSSVRTSNRPLSPLLPQNFSPGDQPPIDSLREFPFVMTENRGSGQNLKNVLTNLSAQTEFLCSTARSLRRASLIS